MKARIRTLIFQSASKLTKICNDSLYSTNIYNPMNSTNVVEIIINSAFAENNIQINGSIIVKGVGDYAFTKIQLSFTNDSINSISLSFSNDSTNSIISLYKIIKRAFNMKLIMIH